MKKPAFPKLGALILFFSLACATPSGTVDAAGPFGAPLPLAREDSYAIGIGYFFYDTQWKPDNQQDFGDVKIQQDIAFLHAELPVSETGALFLRLGGSTLNDIDDSFRFSGSVGYRGVWFGDKQSFLEVGPILFGSYNSNYKSETQVGGGISLQQEVTGFWDASLAIAIQKRFGDRLIVFGGPFGYYGSADAQATSTGLGIDASTTYKDKYNFGGYAGGRYTIVKGLSVEAEAQYKGDFSFGVMVAFSPK